MRIVKILILLFFFQFFLTEKNNAQWTLEIETDTTMIHWEYFSYINVVDSIRVLAFGDYNQIWRRLTDKFWQRITTSVDSVGYGACIAGRGLNNMWITTFIQFTPGANIVRSTNGGLNWDIQVNTGGDAMAFNGIEFSKIHPSYGYAWASAAYKGSYPIKVYKTRDAGNSWLEYQTDIPDEYYGYRPSICITDSNHAWFNLHKDGNYDTVRVLYTTNGGSSFQISKLPLVGYFASALAFKNDNLTGIACIDAQPNYLLRTTNGGISWNVSYLPNFFTRVTKLIWIPNSTTWYASGWNISPSDPKIYKSTNDGFSWFPMSFPDNQTNIVYMDGVSYGNRVYLYAVGNSYTNTGRIYRLAETVNTVGVQNLNIVVDDFKLDQNYPNPFNPDTKIKFHIPKSTFVTLEVFDITGRLVSTPVNKYLSADAYEVNWNAEGFSSGVYFYKLVADNFTSVRRMILLK